ncbi:hypothetical protein H180DRAFT_00483 [Streptomyces sp. WMMB 322]|nr:hypothetical protein H180DRAFT_00483 [Streptomyces sp. WMMB 322]
MPLFAWNEPIKLDGGRAQQVLQRRINQSVAEYEVFNALEISSGGMCTHVREGWNIGKPPYGYAARRYRHPNPTKAERGVTNPGSNPTDCAERPLRRSRTGATTETSATSPSPTASTQTPTATRSRNRPAAKRAPALPGAIPPSATSSATPRNTGYQDFNRRGTRSRGGAYNDPTLWVWSHEPTYEPLIPKWMFDELNARRTAKRGSWDGIAPNTRPATRRTYLFRGMSLCPCSRRMSGAHRRRITYYKCWPKGNNRGRPEPLPGITRSST